VVLLIWAIRRLSGGTQSLQQHEFAGAAGILVHRGETADPTALAQSG
jgi:hypothetical protein